MFIAAQLQNWSAMAGRKKYIITRKLLNSIFKRSIQISKWARFQDRVGTKWSCPRQNAQVTFFAVKFPPRVFKNRLTNGKIDNMIRPYVCLYYHLVGCEYHCLTHQVILLEISPSKGDILSTIAWTISVWCHCDCCHCWWRH